MLLLSYIVLFFGVATSIIGIIFYFKTRTKDNIIFPLQGFWIMEVFTIIFSILLYVFLKEPVIDFKQVNGFTAFVTLGFVGIIGYLHSIIQYDETGFYKPIFIWIKKRYEFSDVEFLKWKIIKTRYVVEERVIIKMPKRKIIINREYRNYFEFMDTMANAYKKAHNRKIPKKQ